MTPSEFERLRKTEPAFLLYFYGDHCSICRDLYPKVRQLIDAHFPRARLLRIDASSHRALAGQMRMLSIPGLLLFLDGREVLRANGLVSIDLLRERMERPYRLYFSS
jgi:thioredoxin-like negative regulator of GroEL